MVVERLPDGEKPVEVELLWCEPDCETRLAVGLAPQEPNVDYFLTCEETLDYHGGYFGMPKKDRKERARELAAQYGVKSLQDAYLALVGRGELSRAHIAAEAP